MAEEAATVLATAPPAAAGARAGSAGVLARPIRWTGRRRRRRRASTRASSRCRRGPAKAPTPTPNRPPRPRAGRPGGASRVPWWERNGQQSPTAAAKPEVGPLRAAARRGAAHVRLARVDAGAPGDAPEVARRGGGGDPRVPRASAATAAGSLLIGAALAGVAAIGTPVMWKLAFASRPTVVSALPIEPAADAGTRRAARPSACTARRPPRRRPPPRASTRICSRPRPNPRRRAAPVAAAPRRPHARDAEAGAEEARRHGRAGARRGAGRRAASRRRCSSRRRRRWSPRPPPPRAPPAPVQAEAVPLGQIFEVSQVEARPSVTSRFDPVLPARLMPARRRWW